MDEQSRGEPIGGSVVHVDDLHVWAAISYLDSPTDYREYLPHDKPKPSAPQDSELVMLDDSQSPWPTLGALTIMALLTCVLLFFITRVWP
jgi:hypothetical protein